MKKSTLKMFESSVIYGVFVALVCFFVPIALTSFVSWEFPSLKTIELLLRVCVLVGFIGGVFWFLDEKQTEKIDREMKELSQSNPPFSKKKKKKNSCGAWCSTCYCNNED